jgi:TolB-like protein/class 3 adenylate cyclase/Tfp pilus assembly protein PilF
VERRLAAILAADVVGYAALMGADEAGTLRRLTDLRREFLEPLITEHRGRIVKLMGDGLLVEFASVVDAVACALAWQTGVAAQDEDLRFRIGINLGDVLVEDGDIHGDGVNIAARLEGVAEPGGICLSGDAYRQARGKVEAEFEDLGEQRLKNVAEPVSIYRLAGESAGGAVSVSSRNPLARPDKPSIAVLPFTNMSGDPDQEYFADGMVEEIITALTRIRWLFVVARDSSFSYKGQPVKLKQVSRELGVRYVLEGSVRKAGNRVRISGQLIDASTGAHLWADRFDGALEDVFDLQDQVTSSVVGAIAPRLERAEIERTRRKPTASLDAYDYYLRGMAAVHTWTREGNDEALTMFRRAIELDPDFAAAYGMAARCYSQRKAGGWVVDRESEAAETERLARRAAALGKDDALALATAGIALAYVVGDITNGNAFIDEALALNPNLAWAWLFSSFVKVWIGEPEIAIECVNRAMQLSPQDFQHFNMQVGYALAHFAAGRYGEASSWAERAMRSHPNYTLAAGTFAASAALGGRLAEAEEAVTRMRQDQPQMSISDLANSFPLQRPEDRAKWAEGLRKAGLPD